MSERSEAAIDLDQRLAEIDRTLRSIQDELASSVVEDAGPPQEMPRRRAPEPPPRARARLSEPPPPAPSWRSAGPSWRSATPPRQREAPLPPRPRRRTRRGRSGPLAAALEAAHERSNPDPLEQITALSGVHTRLLDLSHELLEAYHTLLEHLGAAETPEDEAAEAEIAETQAEEERAETFELTVAAGPFMSLDTVRDFEHALAEIPGVIDVAVRGYERGDRAIVDVQLRDLAASRSR